VIVSNAVLQWVPGHLDLLPRWVNGLAPGGWLVNLDHIGPAGPGDTWDKRLRTARKQFGAQSNGPKHHHNYPLTSVDDHLRALAAAGFTDVEVAWRAFFTCLFMARKDS